MDSDTGHFVDEKEAEAWMQRIAVGEAIEIKGEACEVITIGDREVTLRLLSAGERAFRSMFPR